MKYISLILLFFTNLAYSQGTNIIALRNGSKMVETPPSYAEVTERNLFVKYSPGSLLDETTSPWCSKNSKFPLDFVIELVEEYEINTVEFDTRVEAYNGIEVKDVKVSFSTTSAKEGFKEAGKFELGRRQVQEFPIKGKARWIKLTVLSNYGHKEYAELAEFKAFGAPSKTLSTGMNIDGTWKTNWQNIQFNQDGKTFSGKYAYGNVKGKVTNGTINRNSIEFDWKEGRLEGTALLYMNEEGDRLSGIWQNNHNESDYGLWTMTRTKEVPLSYITESEAKPNEGTAAAGYFAGKEVVLDENIVLKDVLFVRSKAVLLPGSFAELNKLIETLEQDESLNIELSGYTDNTGSASLNVQLSSERVETVKKYLVSKGIKKNRISGKGYGGANPIADNSKESTRRLNRRVEFKLIQQ